MKENNATITEENEKRILQNQKKQGRSHSPLLSEVHHICKMAAVGSYSTGVNPEIYEDLI